jgi:hypothetical protein
VLTKGDAMDYKELDVVKIKKDVLASSGSEKKKYPAGSKGTIIEVFRIGVIVEFVEKDGSCYEADFDFKDLEPATFS